MNLFLSLLLCAVSVAATAQHSRQSTTHTQMADDGKTLSVRVEGEVDGRAIIYQHTFNVACLSRVAKDNLKRRILDSLGIGQASNPPEPPVFTSRNDRYETARVPMYQQAPRWRTNTGPENVPDPSDSQSNVEEQANVTFRCETCTGKIKLALVRSTDDYSFERDTKIDSRKGFFPYQLSLPAGEYRLNYFQNDVLQMQSTFTVKLGEESTVVVK